MTDLTTGLIWLRKGDWIVTLPWRYNIVGSYTDANTAPGLLQASSINADLSDSSKPGEWRLPTKAELYTLTHGSVPISMASHDPFTGIGGGYWSSTSDSSDTSNAYMVDMTTGLFTSKTKESSYLVWPVRNNDLGLR